MFIGLTLSGDDQNILTIRQEVSCLKFIQEAIEGNSVTVPEPDEGKFSFIFFCQALMRVENFLKRDDGLRRRDDHILGVFETLEDNFIANFLSRKRLIFLGNISDYLVELMFGNNGFQYPSKYILAFLGVLVQDIGC